MQTCLNFTWFLALHEMRVNFPHAISTLTVVLKGQNLYVTCPAPLGYRSNRRYYPCGPGRAEERTSSTSPHLQKQPTTMTGFLHNHPL